MVWWEEKEGERREGREGGREGREGREGGGGGKGGGGGRGGRGGGREGDILDWEAENFPPVPPSAIIDKTLYIVVW